ncbi:hypothetical protein Tco_1408454 [Tanacetum coccineum]
MSTSGMSALRLVDGAGLVWVGGNGKGNGGEGIWGSGDDNGVSGDGGGVGKARSLATSSSEGNDMGVWVGIDILEIVRYAGGGGVVAADSSVSNGSVSLAKGHDSQLKKQLAVSRVQ